MQYLNNAAKIIQKTEVEMTITITNQCTMWCPRADHLAVTAMGWTLQKIGKHQGQKQFIIETKGIFLVVGIQKTQFKVGQQPWRFNTINVSP